MGPILDLSCTLLGLAAINGYTKVVDVLAKAEADVSKVLGEDAFAFGCLLRPYRDS
jgi:hypothetical protein